MADVHIHNKKLGDTVAVPEESADSWKDQGWTRATKAQAEEATPTTTPITEDEGA